MYRTIPELLLGAADRDRDGVWLRTDDVSLTFGAAAGRVGATARALRESGVRAGDLVLMTAENTAGYLLCWLGLVSIGAIAVTANPRGTRAELDGLAGQTRPAAVITGGDLRAWFPRCRVLDVAELTAGTLGPGEAGSLAGAVRPEDVAVLIPTSGTTGRAKLVMQTHRAYTMAGEGFPFWMGLTARDRLMTSLPLFHINAPAYSVMGSLAIGAGLVLLPRFSASGFLDAARRHGATEFNAIGAMLEILMRQPPRPDDADTPLRLCYTGPAPTRQRQEEIERRFGLRIVCGYALSESPYGLIWPHGTRPFGTLGAPRQHPTLGTVNRAKVVDDDGVALGPGGTGELLLSNPVVTPGYWGMPDETAATIVDGWLHTGDLVTVNADGTYTFLVRRKEVLRRRGENLSPLEVEEALLSHPAVQDCAVVGVPSELSEEDVKAFVVLAPGQHAGFPELHSWAAERLAAFKVPRFWQLVDALPRTPTARVAKHLLPDGHPPGEYDAEATPATNPGTPNPADGPATPSRADPGTPSRADGPSAQ